MELSSPRFKALAVTAGFSFWFVIITVGIGVFSFELLGIRDRWNIFQGFKN